AARKPANAAARKSRFMVSPSSPAAELPRMGLAKRRSALMRGVWRTVTLQTSQHCKLQGLLRLVAGSGCAGDGHGQKQDRNAPALEHCTHDGGVAGRERS